jgi:mRNA interferase RelE/StbE
MDRVHIQWTETAKRAIEKLPKKVRKGLLTKAGELREAENPASVNKPLLGPLQGYHRICYSRYRAIYSVERDELVSGDCLVKITVRFVAAGIRKEGDKEDIYQLAKKLIRIGIIKPR